MNWMNCQSHIHGDQDNLVNWVNCQSHTHSGVTANEIALLVTAGLIE